MEINLQDYVLFKLNFEQKEKSVLIERKNVTMKFLKNQCIKLLRPQEEFCFAYHPLNSGNISLKEFVL